MTAPRPKPLKNVLLLAFRLALGAIFLFAGATKIADTAAFATEIGNYRLLPSMAPYLAATLPGVEIACGLALIAGTRAWQRAGALVAGLLLAAFTVAVAQVVARGIDVQCGCFGGSSGPVTWVTLVRDVVLWAMAASIYFATTLRPEPASR